MDPNDDAIPLDHMARVGFETMFEERWTSLVPGAIERAVWRNIARAMLAEARRWNAATERRERRKIRSRKIAVNRRTRLWNRHCA